MKCPLFVCIILWVLEMNKICELRKEAGLKQTDLAALIPTSRQSIGKWENDDVDLSTSTIAKLCEIFGCTSDYLLGLSSRRSPAVSESDAALLDAYHAAPPNIRKGIDDLLQPYREKVALSSALPEEQEA